MTTDTDLRAAVASILSMSPKSAPWKPANFPFPQELSNALATICNAVASGELTLTADVDELVKAVRAEIDARHKYENTAVDRGGRSGPKGLAFKTWQQKTADVFTALTAWENRK